MKHIRTILTFLAIAMVSIGLVVANTGSGNQPEVTPMVPVGSLSAFPTIVQTGAKPELTWSITLPENSTDLIEIVDPGTVKPKRDLIMDLRVIGSKIKRPKYRNNGEIRNWRQVLVECSVNYQSQGFFPVFYEKNKELIPNTIAYTQAGVDDSTFTFGGRFVDRDGTWSDFRSSTNGSYVVALEDGDTPPYPSGTAITSQLAPYIATDGTVNIGPREVLVLMELDATDSSSSDYNFQDLILLLTFYDEIFFDNDTEVIDDDIKITAKNLSESPNNGHPKGNNGHGNNVDGIDMSNPGDVPFAEYDTDPNEDDEHTNSLGRGRRVE